MKLTTLQAAVGSASVLFSQSVLASHAHRQAHSHYGKRHQQHSPSVEGPLESPKVEKRTSCSLPSHPDLVTIPGAANAGFAMSPDQGCTEGKYCPIACVSGKVMNQWKPNSGYSYPDSMNGGLYCSGGVAEKPFPSSPYCVDGTGAVTAVNTCGKVVSFCQTVLPGNEAMLIPTDVTSSATLAVPGPDYWAGTAAHYYVNAPGVPASEGCVWGTPSKPIGNWSPYVAGANTDSTGETFVKIAWNPEYTGSDLVNTKPTFGLRIECPNGGCNGLPCSIDPTTDGLGVNSPVGTVGVGGASFCVVTVPKGSTANIVVFNTDGSTGSSSSAAHSSSSSTSTTSSPSTSTSSSSSAAHTSSSAGLSSSTTLSSPPTASLVGAIFHENATSISPGRSSYTGTTTLTSPSSTASDAAPAATSSKNEAGMPDQGGAAFLGLIVAFVAAAALY
ncbi:hypothetical protein GQ53DRAFT_683534 [Thozetella sp. PMI_491]|nr:hypothetical protein GQ53DRAFT_683534 [Thozetella sp. PMI_491]